MNPSMEFAQKFMVAYNAKFRPLCQELKLPQTALDILLFLANNPGYDTASEIVEIRKLKANLVSVNVDKLVREGYLRREMVEGDRRKVRLRCTEQAQPVIERGRAVQNAFLEQLSSGLTPGQKLEFRRTLECMSRTLDDILEGET